MRLDDPKQNKGVRCETDNNNSDQWQPQWKLQKSIRKHKYKWRTMQTKVVKGNGDIREYKGC